MPIITMFNFVKKKKISIIMDFMETQFQIPLLSTSSCFPSYILQSFTFKIYVINTISTTS